MIYLAVDKKSNLATRIASLIALGIMVLSIVICLIIIFTDNRVPVDPSMLIVGAPVEVNPDTGGNFWILLLLIIFFFFLFSIIAFQAMK
jgi:amino acid transporter